MAPITVNGRFPGERGASFIGVRIENVKFDHESATIRLGHPVHPDFWMDISVHESILVTWYEQIQQAHLTMAEDDEAYRRWVKTKVGLMSAWIDNDRELRRAINTEEVANVEGQSQGHDTRVG
jgi:hypothetical protein